MGYDVQNARSTPDRQNSCIHSAKNIVTTTVGEVSVFLLPEGFYKVI
jgi:hypothetical protein